MATKRAPKGGAVGANGEFYEGGKFINTITENDKRLGSKPKKVSKSQIMPYVWVETPEGKRSIFTKISGIFAQVTGDIAHMREDDRLQQTLDYFGVTHEYAVDLVERYNRGERWISE
jgi:hypothetical protein